MRPWLPWIPPLRPRPCSCKKPASVHSQVCADPHLASQCTGNTNTAQPQLACQNHTVSPNRPEAAQDAFPWISRSADPCNIDTAHLVGTGDGLVAPTTECQLRAMLWRPANSPVMICLAEQLLLPLHTLWQHQPSVQPPLLLPCAIPGRPSPLQ
jgi:hypothetical protein